MRSAPYMYSAKDRIIAANSLLDRAYGKPVQQIEAGSPGQFEHMTDSDLTAYTYGAALRIVEGGKK